MDKSLTLPFDFDIDIDLTIMHPSELRMEMESAIEDAVETAEDIIVRMQMMEPERMMEQYCQSINETASESAKSVKNGVLNIFSKILTNVLSEDVAAIAAIGNGDNEPAYYEGQNPLMIDLVLKSILNHLKTRDLCSCRLVCKLWNVEAGAYIRRKHRIVFSTNSIQKMANFTAFMKETMKAQLLDEFEEVDVDGVVKVEKNGDREEDPVVAAIHKEIFDKSHNDHDHHPHSQQTHPDSPIPYLSDSQRQDSSSINEITSHNSSRNLPAYTDFSFTAQFPQINFSRAVVRDFSTVYGQYVKKLEIFFPNDSSLTAKDFRQFFLCGMPNVQFVHFVNLPTKLTQSSFLQCESSNSSQSTSGTANNTLHHGHRFSVDNNGSSSAVATFSLNSNGKNLIKNNNILKDNNKTTNCNKKDNEENFVDVEKEPSPSHYRQDNGNNNNNDDDSKNDGEKDVIPDREFKVSHHHQQDCLLKWNSLTHLKIDRTLLKEIAWSQFFLQDLFCTMPNLKHYELWTWNTTGGDGHSNPYIACLTESQRENLVSLYPGSMGESLLTSLADYGLHRLKKLHLPVFSGEVSAQSVELLLMNLKGTLEELQVNCSSMQDSRMIHFPRMEKLLVLHMIISVPWKNVYTLFTPSIEYQNQFPVLETLKLELAVYHDFGFIHYFFPSGSSSSSRSVCKTLRELDISFSGYRDEKFIGIVAKIFPNLVKLRLDGYGNRILASICLYLQKLEYFEMYLIYGFNVDDQLTGIDRKICNEIRKCGRYLDFKMDDDATQLHPSLANLSKLKTLKIKQKDYQAKYWPQAQCITDITGYFALAKITTLRHLHVESVKFSPECRQYLATILEDCWLDFL